MKCSKVWHSRVELNDSSIPRNENRLKQTSAASYANTTNVNNTEHTFLQTRKCYLGFTILVWKKLRILEHAIIPYYTISNVKVKLTTYSIVSLIRTRCY